MDPVSGVEVAVGPQLAAEGAWAAEAQPFRAHPLARRGVRIRAYILAIVALSLGDLYMTLMFLTHYGMFESNPIARWLMSLDASQNTVITILALYKTCTVGIGVGILYRLRQSRCAEVGALLCVSVLTWLTVHWIGYAEQVPEAMAYAEVVGHEGPFVSLTGSRE